MAGIATASVGGVLAPSASGACSTAVREGRNAVVACRSVGHEQAFVVPVGVRSLSVVAVGAPGGSGTPGSSLSFPARGGAGGVAAGDIRVTPGRMLFVLVGGVGGTREPQGGAGGFNGGGRGGASANGAGGGGGGASDVRTCSTVDRTCDTLASRLIVAAGGGGGGGGGAFEGAPAGAGGAAGDDGAGGAGDGLGAGGGATVTTVGAGGPGAGAGQLGAGGSGAGSLPRGDAGGGGGGGGLLGGGGGSARTGGDTGGSGGGAGSSSGPAGTQFARSSGGQGLVRITYVAVSSGNPPPSVTIIRPRPGRSISRDARLVVAGRARDASGVRGVALRIQRLPRVGGLCTWLDPVVGLGRAGCDEPPSLLATLRAGGSWTYRVPARAALRGGRYRVTAYGTDESGIYGNSAPASAGSVRFRVRG
jgi:hypothetical protein